MSHIRLSTNRLRRFILLAKCNPIETGFFVCLLLAILAPLRCPTIKGYSYLNVPEIKDDLQMCLGTKRSHELTLCPLVSKNLGMD